MQLHTHTRPRSSRGDRSVCDEADFPPSPGPSLKAEDEAPLRPPSGPWDLISAFSGNFSLPFLRLRGPSSFALPFSWAPRGGTSRVGDCSDEEEVPYWAKDAAMARTEGPLQGEARSWGSLLVPKSQGEEAGIGVSLVLDEEGRYLPAHCERLLLLSAVCLCINPISAFYFGCATMGYMSLLLFLTSIVHWSRPRLGWRRAVDIFTARIVVLSFCFAAVATAPPFACAIYLWGFLLVLGLHALGWHFSRTKRHLEGTVCHMGLHFLGTAVNVYLFSTIGDATVGGWTDF